MNKKNAVGSGIGFGCALAMVISYVKWKKHPMGNYTWFTWVDICSILHNQILKFMEDKK